MLSIDDVLSDWLPEWAEKIPNGEEMTLRQSQRYGFIVETIAVTDPTKAVQAEIRMEKSNFTYPR